MSIRPKVRAVPEIHQPENSGLNAPHPGCGIALEQVQSLKPFENPEWQIDLDAVWIESLPVEMVQSFAYIQLVDFGAPARSHWICCGGLHLVIADHLLRKERNCALKRVSSSFGRKNDIFQDCRVSGLNPFHISDKATVRADLNGCNLSTAYWSDLQT
jgi:hypothetical protein